MKKILFVLAAAAVISGGTAAMAGDVSVEVNGKVLDMDARIVNDRTLVPLRAVSNALGCGVAWNEETRGITICRAGEDAETDIDITVAWIDKPRAFKLSGVALEDGVIMDVPPQIIEDRTFVPIRAIAELFGAQVSWNGDTRTAIIDAPMPGYIYPDTTAENLIGCEVTMNDVYDEYDRYLKGECKTVNAVITLEDGGTIELELYPELAPITVDNFVELAKSGYYDGLTFHRVIKDFMIQGGWIDVNGNEPEREVSAIKGEFIINGVTNFIPHERGVVSMARTVVEDSATSQFFIMHVDTPSLNGNYAAFGKVTSGMENVDKIANVATDAEDMPLEAIVIKSIEIKGE